LLLAATGSVTVNGTVDASGGSDTFFGAFGGAGGGIRIVCDAITGDGALLAVGAIDAGPTGGNGRVRLEANLDGFTGSSAPAFTVGVPVENPRLFRTEGDGIPEIRAVTVGAANVPADPRPSTPIPPDVNLAEPGTYSVSIEALNVPSTSVVTVRVAPQSGPGAVYTASYTGDGDDPNETLWSADVDLSGGFSSVQVYAALVE